MDMIRLRLDRQGRCWMLRKDYDSVKMMREIRDKLSERFRDSATEEQELQRIREKYGLLK